MNIYEPVFIAELDQATPVGGCSAPLGAARPDPTGAPGKFPVKLLSCKSSRHLLCCLYLVCLCGACLQTYLVGFVRKSGRRF